MNQRYTRRGYVRTATARREAFTLIELLVVIAIFALLMAILMPALQRIREQARTVACRANLRQASVEYYAFVHDNDGHFPGYDAPGEQLDPNDWMFMTRPPYEKSRELLICPSASKPVSIGGCVQGATRWAYAQASIVGSYAHNMAVWGYRFEYTVITRPFASRWKSVYEIKGSASTPIVLDSAWFFTAPLEGNKPPLQEDAFDERDLRFGMSRHCIDRHSGGVNALLADWSVRKVGLKELWTLKWTPEFNTAGPYTRAGGVQYEDWPKWMRSFKDQ